MTSTTLPHTTQPPSLHEAQTLVRRCAKPSSTGESVKAAIRRASQLLSLPFSRVRNIWYGDARRIDAHEMDRLRQAAERADHLSAIAEMEALRGRLSPSATPTDRKIVCGLTAAIDAIRRKEIAGADSIPHVDQFQTRSMGANAQASR